MAKPEETAALEDVELQICFIVQEAIRTHGEKIALGGLAAAAGLFTGSLDRARPNLNVLAAFMRAFTTMYDASYFQPDLSGRQLPKGWKPPAAEA